MSKQLLKGERVSKNLLTRRYGKGAVEKLWKYIVPMASPADSENKRHVSVFRITRDLPEIAQLSTELAVDGGGPSVPSEEGHTEQAEPAHQSPPQQSPGDQQPSGDKRGGKGWHGNKAAHIAAGRKGALTRRQKRLQHAAPPQHQPATIHTIKANLRGDALDKKREFILEGYALVSDIMEAVVSVAKKMPDDIKDSDILQTRMEFAEELNRKIIPSHLFPQN